MEKEFSAVSIPTALYKRVETAIKGTDVSSVASYVAKVVQEALTKDESKPEVFSQADEEKVKDRLKALGYID
jgi:metal-responsive CopG/Arc/MetJ family transcriptional regulator